ncbi:MAG TPA: hypothetical protein VLC92_08795 [Rhodocyclaceae bacterium]|nr:hypothetical protein [Rhodocyclaceae bacterium]
MGRQRQGLCASGHTFILRKQLQYPEFASGGGLCSEHEQSLQKSWVIGSAMAGVTLPLLRQALALPRIAFLQIMPPALLVEARDVWCRALQ